MKRHLGGLYGICVDCDPSQPHFLTIDAFDSHDNGTNPPVSSFCVLMYTRGELISSIQSLLFSQTFSPPSVHVITIHNEADPRGTPVGNSQLTLDRFELDIPVGSGENSPSIVGTTLSTAQPSPSRTVRSDSTSASFVSTTISTTDASQPSPSITIGSHENSTSFVGTTSPTGQVAQPSPSRSVPTQVTSSNNTTVSSGSVPLLHPCSEPLPLAAIIGIALAGVVVSIILTFLLLWLKKRRLRYLCYLRSWINRARHSNL